LIVGGAQENTAASVLGLLEKEGLKVDLLSGPTTGSEGSLEQSFAQRSGVLRLVPPLVREVHPIKDWLALGELTRIFRQTRPHIVHTHSSKAGVLGRIAAHRAKVPVIVHTIHGPSFGTFQGAVANHCFQAAERYAGRYTTHFVSVAHAMTEQYLRAGIGKPEQYTRVWSGFQLEPFLSARNDPALRASMGIRPTDVVVGKIARLFELKGHDDLLEAAPNILKSFPAIKFLLIGGGPWEARLKEKAQALGGARNFIFTGLVPPAEVARYVGIMDFLVHLSRREGLPRALPQALVAAKPVIAYDCDGAREVCIPNQTGFLVQPGDLAGLGQRVIELASNPALREKLGSSGQQMVRKSFPVQRMVDDLHDLYLQLAAKQRMSEMD
jgi:glycosyltransferase involved in cell wall biosynthesis